MGTSTSKVLGQNAKRTCQPSNEIQQSPSSPALATACSSNGSSPSVDSRFLCCGQPDAPSPHFRFLDLPAEMRVMIYEELVVVGKIFYTHNLHDVENGRRCHGFELFKKPKLTIFLVCKQIHTEAEKVYLTKNLFVLPVNWPAFQPFTTRNTSDEVEDDDESSKQPAAPRYLFSASALDSVKNISISIDQKQLEHYGCSHSAWTQIYEPAIGPFDQLTRHQRFDHIHDLELDDVADQWLDLVHSLPVPPTGLHYLEVDFTNAYCPIGCCRPIHLAVGDWITLVAPKKLDVIGVLPDEERQFTYVDLNGMHYTRRILKQQYGLRFRQPGEPTPWDEWMIRHPAAVYTLP
ncbi:hypothetical protein BU26DRAFT_521173 [Trematosphaeria pertusa]|uniref:Uncharacterized protein n=1 Tax=Trematosphaeria pertusa TaxID=390896 RepID=A0A6A6I9I6_9PLEO|nr:uncharacterized protein BU26DRAFT_521173 [Trematosphaeria pertusa]KAF2246738.1 hypothetical protein BU26DRAFT_521173 [Trematosphaeria pertusa]